MLTHNARYIINKYLRAPLYAAASDWLRQNAALLLAITYALRVLISSPEALSTNQSSRFLEQWRF